MNNDSLIIAHIEDKIEQSASRFYVTHTGFLDLHEQSVAAGVCRRAEGVRTFFYGGYDDAERRMLICCPEDLAGTEEEILAMDDFVTVIRAETSGDGRKLSHRDYLGSLMAIGIERSVTGDILVRDDGADIIVMPEIADFILSQYSSAGREPLRLTERSVNELIIPESHVKTVSDTVSSLRLDNVLSAAFGVSRRDAAEAVKRGQVFVDHEEASKADRKVPEGAVIVMRGKGRAVLESAGGTTRKGRIRVEITRYL